MSFGKLRASYGINGNASGIGAYTLQEATVQATATVHSTITEILLISSQNFPT